MPHPIFENFPKLKDKIPALRFAHCPTPVSQIQPLQSTEPQHLWIKRDDLSHSQYGGNKVRKLEYILAEALATGAREIVTFGAIGTNHGLATALFAKRFGLDVTLFLFDQPYTPAVKNNLLCMQALGAKLRYCGSLAHTAFAFYLSQYLLNRKAYHLFAGGSNLAGCIGFVNAAFELKKQISEGVCPVPDSIICPVGSSATVAGLTLGCRLAGLDTRVIGVRVAPSHLGPIPTCTPQTIQALMKQTYKLLAKHSPDLPQILLTAPALEQTYYGSGYGHATQAGEQAQAHFAQHGIILDTTYTAKAAAFSLDYCHANPNKNVLYWHTYNSADTTAICAHTKPSQLPKKLQNSMLNQ